MTVRIQIRYNCMECNVHVYVLDCTTLIIVCIRVNSFISNIIITIFNVISSDLFTQYFTACCINLIIVCFVQLIINFSLVNTNVFPFPLCYRVQ